jgi:hypothetical protein
LLSLLPLSPAKSSSPASSSSQLPLSFFGTRYLPFVDPRESDIQYFDRTGRLERRLRTLLRIDPVRPDPIPMGTATVPGKAYLEMIFAAPELEERMRRAWRNEPRRGRVLTSTVESASRLRHRLLTYRWGWRFELARDRALGRRAKFGTRAWRSAVQEADSLLWSAYHWAAPGQSTHIDGKLVARMATGVEVDLGILDVTCVGDVGYWAEESWNNSQPAADYGYRQSVLAPTRALTPLVVQETLERFIVGELAYVQTARRLPRVHVDASWEEGGDRVEATAIERELYTLGVSDNAVRTWHELGASEAPLQEGQRVRLLQVPRDGASCADGRCGDWAEAGPETTGVVVGNEGREVVVEHEGTEIQLPAIFVRLLSDTQGRPFLLSEQRGSAPQPTVV